MSDKKSHFKAQLSALHENCFQGKLHFQVWEDLNTSLKDNELYAMFNLFWLTTLKAQLEAAQLHLMKMFDISKSNINIEKIINYAKANSEELFDQDGIELVLNELREFEKEINGYKQTIDKLKDIRDKHFVHLSKSDMGSYDQLYKEYSELRNQIWKILILCEDLIQTFSFYALKETWPMKTGREYQTRELIDTLCCQMKQKKLNYKE